MKFLANFTTKAIAITLSAIVLIMLCTTTYCYIEEMQIRPWITCLYYAVVLAASLILCFVAVKIHQKSRGAFLIFVTALSGVIFFFWNRYANTLPTSDYEIIYNGAKRILDGTFAQEAFDKTNYFYYFNHQIGHTMLMAGEIKLFGDNLPALKVVEALYMIAANILVYFVVGKYTGNDEIGAAASILYTCYLPDIFGGSILNNQHLSAVFLLAALYLSLYPKWWSYLAAGTALALGNFIRPLGIVALPAFILYLIWYAFTQKQIVRCFGRAACMIVTYALLSSLIGTALIHTGITPLKVTQSPIPYFKFVIGLARHEGDYNIANAPYYLGTVDFDYDEYNRQTLDFVKDQLLKTPKKTVLFVTEKMYVFLSRLDNQLFFAVTKEVYNRAWLVIVRDIGHVQYWFLLLVSFLYLARQFRRKQFSIHPFTIFFILLVCAHLFIETQARYRYELYICLTMWGGNYLYYVLQESGLLRKKEMKNLPQVEATEG